MNNYKVYCHTSLNGKRYVGISNNPEKRWNNGKGYIKNYLFYRAIEKEVNKKLVVDINGNMLIFDFYIILCYNKYVKRERGIPLGI